jgi:phosphatidylethanolamine/phosphatidyl-N-methylethanolamine N-methyltransferase
MRETVQFMHQVLTKFRQTGALVPSGPLLARAMVAQIPALEEDEIIVELGPGTGVFTRELARRFPFNPIVAIEFNERFAERLQGNMPDINVIAGCASLLPDYLDDLGMDKNLVGAVVSGLPLLSLPKDLCDDIFGVVAECLAPGKRYVQFTYSKRAWKHVTPPGFRLERTRRVWLNLPPAEVLPFTRLAA